METKGNAVTVGAQVDGVSNATANVNGSGQGLATNNQQNNSNTSKQSTQERTYTQDEFEAELDRRTQQGINTAREKWARELATKVENARSEGERLATMTAQERAAEEQKQAMEKFNKEREKYERDKLEFETTKLLAENDLPVSFAAILAKDNAETTKANVDAFSKAWSDAIQKAVDVRLKGSAPTTSSGSESDVFFKNIRTGAGLK